MKILNHIFGKKAPTSATIAVEIEKARKEYDGALAKRVAGLAGLSTMSDAEHQKAEVEYEAHRRAADRAAARITELEKAHAEALAAEAEAERIAAEQRLRDRVEAARQAVEVEAAELLREYDVAAAKVGDILARLDAINAETNAVNEAIRHRPDIEGVASIDRVHRKHPDQRASERRETRPVWRYAHGATVPAKEKADGTFERPEPIWIHHLQRFETAELGEEEVTVTQTRFRPGRYENPLSAIHLPPGFAKGGSAHWPRQK